MAKRNRVVSPVAPVTPVSDAAVAVVPAESAAVPAVVVDAPVLGVVGELPTHMAALRSALASVNAHTATTPESLRADAVAVTALLLASVGDRPLPPKNRGRFTGLRTYDFQNTLFAVNDRPDWRLTDRTLAVAWLVELPSNRCDFAVHADYIGSTRSAYRSGRHGSNVIDPTNFASRAWPVPTAAE